MPPALSYQTFERADTFYGVVPSFCGIYQTLGRFSGDCGGFTMEARGATGNSTKSEFVLMDVKMAFMDCIKTTRMIKRCRPQLVVIGLSVCPTDQFALAARVN
jgi:glycine/serine hydroxymethyltransferase